MSVCTELAEESSWNDTYLSLHPKLEQRIIKTKYILEGDV